MDGGGFFQGTYPHPTVANKIIARCDVAGFYSLLNGKWQLIGNFSQGQDNNWGGASFAWHPTDNNTFFIMCGKYLTGSNATAGSIYKSTDNGVTLTKITSFPSLLFGANENQRRLAGERIAICPTLPNIILVGTYSDSSSAGKGIYRSTDGGTSWNQITLTNLAPSQTISSLNLNNGQTSIVFDIANSGTCYCAVFGNGVSKSTDYGATWTFIGGAKYVYRLVCYNSNLYSAAIVSGSGELPADTSGYAGVSVYIGSSWTNKLSLDIAWLDISSFTGEITAGYHYDSYWRKSSNGGTTWNTYNIGNSYANAVSYQDNIPYPVGYGIGCFAYDKVTTNSVWAGDFYYVWKNTAYSTVNSTWINYAKGIENTVAYASCFVGSDFYSGWYDIYAFKHDLGLAKPPTTKLGGGGNASPKYPSGLSIAYCAATPTTIAVVGSDYANTSDVVATKDGSTWNKYTGLNLPSRIAISSTNPNLWVATCRGYAPYFSDNGGASWSAIALESCVPTGIYYVGAPLVADASNGNRFWLTNDDLSSGNYGNLYRLDYNAGAIAVTTVNAGTPKSYDGTKFYNLKSISGYLFLSCFDTGLYYSTNNGVSFTQITAVQNAKAICFGMAKTGSSNPTLYMYGKISGTESLYESNDLGITWDAKLDSDPSSSFNVNSVGIFQPITHISASQIEYNKVFIGTDGHGGFYSSATLLSSGGGAIAPGLEIPGQTTLYLNFV
jgi:hypothetical protein